MKRISRVQRLTAHLLWASLLGGCVSSAAWQTDEAIEFRKRVGQTINEGLTNSEAEVYLTRLSEMSNEEIRQFSDRVCESIRRGTRLQTLTESLRAHNPHDMPFPQIAIVSERQRCPEKSLPSAQWRRSLLHRWERVNGGSPLS